MFKLRKVVLVILLLVGVTTDIASTQDDEVCIPIRRSSASEDGRLNETWVTAVAGLPGERGEIGPPGVPGPAGNPGICACDPSEIQQVRTELNAEIKRNKEKFANLTEQISAFNISLHEPTLHEMFCATPPAPTFGSIMFSHKRVPYNQSIFYTCDEGYVMVGVSSNILVAKCQQNGTWTRETPVCVDHPCNSNPCLRGICILQANNSYHCQCPPGYEGRNCSIINGQQLLPLSMPSLIRRTKFYALLNCFMDPCNSYPCRKGICVLQGNNSYHCQCLPGYEGRNCSIIINDSCSNTIGLADKRIEAEQLSASSSQNSMHLPKHARLDLQPDISGGTHGGFWVPTYPYRAGEWIQVDLMTNVEVVAIITQGDLRSAYGITRFKISYGTSVHQLQVIQDNNGNDVIFQANPERDGKTINNFPHPVSARYIRLIVQEWQDYPALRMEYITC